MPSSQHLYAFSIFLSIALAPCPLTHATPFKRRMRYATHMYIAPHAHTAPHTTAAAQRIPYTTCTHAPPFCHLTALYTTSSSYLYLLPASALPLSSHMPGRFFYCHRHNCTRCWPHYRLPFLPLHCRLPPFPHLFFCAACRAAYPATYACLPRTPLPHLSLLSPYTPYTTRLPLPPAAPSLPSAL